MHNLIASRRSATVPPADLAADILAESRAATARRGAAKPTHGQQDRHCPTADRQIRQRSDITAVAGPRQGSAIGTAGLERSKTTVDHNAIGADVLMFNNYAMPNQAQPLDRSAHEKSGLQRPSPLLPRSIGAARSNLHEKCARAQLGRRSTRQEVAIRIANGDKIVIIQVGVHVTGVQKVPLSKWLVW